MGVRKIDPFIKVRSDNNCAPEFFKVEDETNLYAVTPDKNIKVSFSEVLSYRLPRMLLRPKYQSFFDKGSLHYYTFDVFSHMVKLITSHSDEAIMVLQCLLQEETLFGFSREIMSKIVEYRSILEHFTIFVCLLVRIYSISLILNTESYEKSDEDIHNLWLFLDTHVDLCLAIKNSGFYLDKDLKSEMRSQSERLTPIYNEFYPHDLRFFDHNDSPYIWQIIYSSGDKIPDVEKKRQENIFTVLSQKIFTKIGVFTCQKRCISSTTAKYARNYGDIEKLIRRICLISSLGNLPWVKNRPPFGRRIEIYDYFLTTKENIYTFMETTGNTLLFMLREFLVYFNNVDYVLNFTTSLDQKWTNIKKIITSCMDNVREIVTTMCRVTTVNDITTREPEILFSEKMINKMISTVDIHYDSCLDYGSKLNKVLPEIFFCNKIEEFFRKKVLTLQNTVEPQNNKMEPQATDYIKPITHNRIKAIAAHIYQSGAMHMNNFFQMRWLKYMGVGDQSYFYLRKIYYQYCCLDRPDNSITKKVEKLYGKGKYDFHIIRIYLKELILKYSYMQYRLPKCVMEKQLRTHSRKMNYIIDVSEEQFNTNCVNYYCKVCNKWSANVIKPFDKNGLKSMCSHTPRFCAIDLCTDKMVCIRPSGVTKSIHYINRSNNKKGKQTNKKTNKTVSLNTKCYETELTPVNMIGIIQKLNGRNYVRCTICDSIMEFDSSKFNILGLNCGNHTNYTMETQVENDNALNEIRKVKKCFFCGSKAKSNSKNRVKHRDVVKMIVIDDLNRDNLHLRNVFVCGAHHETIRYTTIFPFLSNVITQIQTYGCKVTRDIARSK